MRISDWSSDVCSSDLFFDEQTSTFSYVVHHPADSVCAVIDSVLDYDPKSGRTSTDSADKIMDFIRQRQLQVQWLLETHAHADHLSAASYIQAQDRKSTRLNSSH